MGDRPDRILLAEPDADLVEILVAGLSRRFNAQITCASDAGACLDADLCARHDLVISEVQLPDAGGLQLAEELLALSPRPVILLADEPSCDEAIEAVRIGAQGFFLKPFPMGELLGRAAELLREERLSRLHAAKYRQMRELVRRVIRERRDLMRRTELVCRDLVGAQRQLVDRMFELERGQVARHG